MDLLNVLSFALGDVGSDLSWIKFLVRIYDHLEVRTRVTFVRRCVHPYESRLFCHFASPAYMVVFHLDSRRTLTSLYSLFSHSQRLWPESASVSDTFRARPNRDKPFGVHCGPARLVDNRQVRHL